MWRKFGEHCCRFLSFDFHGKWPQEISQRVLDIFHSAPNKILFTPATMGGGVGFCSPLLTKCCTLASQKLPRKRLNSDPIRCGLVAAAYLLSLSARHAQQMEPCRAHSGSVASCVMASWMVSGGQSKVLLKTVHYHSFQNDYRPTCRHRTVTDFNVNGLGITYRNLCS